MNLIVVVIFEFDGFILRFFNLGRCLLQDIDMVEQSRECGIELCERGLCQGFFVHIGKNGVAAFDHFDLQVELQSFEMSGLSLAVVGAE